MAGLLNDGLGMGEIFRRVLVQFAQDDVRDFEDQVTGAAVAGGAAVHVAHAVEDRVANAQQRDAQALAAANRKQVETHGYCITVMAAERPAMTMKTRRRPVSIYSRFAVK
jgi:hypothetical protein